MKRLMTTFSLALLSVLTPACIADPDDGGATADAGAGGTEVPVNGAALALTFVSGHLGNYWDCPGEANGAGAAAGAPREAAGDAAGACPPGEECVSIINCEAAMVMLEVENETDGALSDFRIERIVLVNDDGTTEDLEGLGIVDAETQAPPAALPAGASRTLRVDFRGPARDPNDDGNRFLRLELRAGESAAGSLETPPLFSVPAVAT
jgi:hypothetical protein